jgi:hypothetical protein
VGDDGRADAEPAAAGGAYGRKPGQRTTALELLQGTGLTRFSPVEPQQWMIASFEHHTSPHGLPRPHIHNIVITSLTTGAPTQKTLTEAEILTRKRTGRNIRTYGPITGLAVEPGEIPVVEVIVFHAHAE